MSHTERDEDIVERAATGEPYAAIARDHAISRNRVSAIALDAGVVRGRGARPSPHSARARKQREQWIESHAPDMVTRTGPLLDGARVIYQIMWYDGTRYRMVDGDTWSAAVDAAMEGTDAT